MIVMILLCVFVQTGAFSNQVNVQHVEASEVPSGFLRVHYDYGAKDLSTLGTWYWNDVKTPPTQWPEGTWFDLAKVDAFGAYVDIELAQNPKSVGFLINNRSGQNETKDVMIDLYTPSVNEVWLTSDNKLYYYNPKEVPSGFLRVNFQSHSGMYEPWGLWYWGDGLNPPASWPMDALAFSNGQVGAYGSYVDVPLKSNPQTLGFLLNQRSNSGIQTKDMTFTDFTTDNQVFIKEGVEGYFNNPYYHSTLPVEKIPEEHPGVLDIRVQATVNKPFNYSENAILALDVDNHSNAKIRFARADLSALGGAKAYTIAPELMEVAIGVNDTIQPGSYSIPVTVVDDTGGTYTATATAVITAHDTTKTTDWDESLIYFMVTDRFKDGNRANNDPYGIGYTTHADGNPMGTYQGGDFKGVTEKLDYLKGLGINTIWITPIVENIAADATANDPSKGAYYAYHGYWASDFETLNPHLGTLDEFHTLIDEAASRDIKIMADVVVNHPGYGTEGKFSSMLRDKSGPTDQTMMLAGLPDFKTEDQTVREQLVKWQADWINKSTTAKGNGLAYFRVDTVKHVDNTTWQLLKLEAIKQNPHFKMIGEMFGATYKEQNGYLGSGGMDSLLDFGFKDIADKLVEGKIDDTNKILAERNQRITTQMMLGQFLSSHDEDGFLYTHEHDLSKFYIASSLQMTSKGQPVIYYGEEIGLTGPNNWPEYGNRYNFDWSKTEGNPMLSHYKKLTAFRHQYSDVFAKGDYAYVAGSDEEGYFVFSRSWNGEVVYVGLNTTNSDKVVQIPYHEMMKETAIDHYNNKTYTVENTAQGKGFSVMLPSRQSGGTILVDLKEAIVSPPIDSDHEVRKIDVADIKKHGQTNLEKVTIEKEIGVEALPDTGANETIGMYWLAPVYIATGYQWIYAINQRRGRR